MKKTAKETSFDNFFKIDLHIHTPSSSCYKGKKDDEEYFKILETAKKNDLRIIAITDHNSIEGYKKLLCIKEALAAKRDSYQEITDSKEVHSKIIDIKRKLSLFSNILILPGIEFEVSNGIHLLVIFNPSVNTDIIERFLLDGGYDKNSSGIEEPSILSKWDILTFFQETKKYDCIVIDAHTDSNKGIYNTIPSGMLRANCFKADQLVAVCFNNEKQKNQLQHTIQTSKDYSRSTSLSFVNFSDAHNHTDVGSRHTWVKLKEVTFEELKSAFINPSEMVTIEKPSIERILNRLIKDDNSYGLLDLSPENIDTFQQLACALNNSIGGFILFGVSDKKNKIGLSLQDVPQNMQESKKQEFIDIINSVKENIEPQFYFRITPYYLQNQRVIISVNIPKNRNLVSIKDDGRLFTIKNKQLHTMGAQDVQFLISERTTDEISSVVSKKIAQIKKDCQLVETYFSSLPIIRRFEQNSKKVKFKLKVEQSVKLSDIEIEKLLKYPANGKSKGNIFFLREVTPSRYPSAYLRYSLPLFNIRKPTLKPDTVPTIYIAPGGGIFFSPRNYSYFSNLTHPILKYRPEHDDKYSYKFITCFLKSSFWLWYCNNKFASTDNFSPTVFNSIRYPNLLMNGFTTNLLSEIEHKFDLISKEEMGFLKKIPSIERPEDQNELVILHNRKVDTFAYAIDKAIYTLIGLSEYEIGIIEQNLRLNEIYLPPQNF